jgi:hypothetical protein
MREHEEHPQEGPTWRNMAIGAGTIVFAVSGYLFGDTLSSIRQEYRDVRATLDARASLPPRLEALEKRHEIVEQHLREVEQWQWQNSPKH